MTGFGPLNGVRALCLTHAWLGTFCTELLALAGAEVIQVEAQRRPDGWRSAHGAQIPAALHEIPTAQHFWNCSPFYNAANLNKLGITLDLQTPDGLRLFRKLVTCSDVFVENFSPRVMQNLGIDYPSLHAIKPDLIMCSLSAYGQTGPWRDVLGIGGTIEPASGMSSLLGYEDGPPMNSGQMLPDPVGGYYGFAAIVTALRYRARTGQGQNIDLSMQESNQTLIGDAVLQYVLTGAVRRWLGNRHLTYAPHGIYPAAGVDQWVAIAVENEAQWLALCEAAGHPEWRDDPRYMTNATRKANEDALDVALRAWTAAQPRDALAKLLATAGVIATPALDAHEVAADPIYRERGVVVDVTHPEARSWPQPGVPYHFGRTPGRVERPAPCLGEHSAEVLARLLAVSAEEYDELVQAGVTGASLPEAIDTGGTAP